MFALVGSKITMYCDYVLYLLSFHPYVCQLTLHIVLIIWITLRYSSWKGPKDYRESCHLSYTQSCDQWMHYAIGHRVYAELIASSCSARFPGILDSSYCVTLHFSLPLESRWTSHFQNSPEQHSRCHGWRILSSLISFLIPLLASTSLDFIFPEEIPGSQVLEPSCFHWLHQAPTSLLHLGMPLFFGTLG